MSGVLKSQNSDFKVVEDLGFEPSGEGEHLLVQVEKSGLSTPELISRLSSDYGVHPRRIGYSGLKDKNALTVQWLTLHLPGQGIPDARRAGDGYRVLRTGRHRMKLRRGTHKANLFEIKIRDVTVLPETAQRQLADLARHGMANYFGPQRFGRRGDNVEQALERLNGGRVKRQQKSLLLSALRSHLFNQILAQRIRLGAWRRPLEGDVFMLRGSHSIFSEPLNEELIHRFEDMDISSTASLYGGGHNRLGGAALEIERGVYGACPEIVACLDSEQPKLQMRPLRVAVEQMEYEMNSRSRVLQLRARLPAGSYLTSLLGHFINAKEI